VTFSSSFFSSNLLLFGAYLKRCWDYFIQLTRFTRISKRGFIMPQLNVKLVHGNGNRRSDAPHGAFATSTKREVGARGSNNSACAVSPVRRMARSIPGRGGCARVTGCGGASRGGRATDQNPYRFFPCSRRSLTTALLFCYFFPLSSV
jgi:hypothetical protein